MACYLHLECLFSLLFYISYFTMSLAFWSLIIIMNPENNLEFLAVLYWFTFCFLYTTSMSKWSPLCYWRGKKWRGRGRLFCIYNWLSSYVFFNIIYVLRQQPIKSKSLPWLIILKGYSNHMLVGLNWNSEELFSFSVLLYLLFFPSVVNLWNVVVVLIVVFKLEVITTGQCQTSKEQGLNFNFLEFYL